MNKRIYIFIIIVFSLFFIFSVKTFVYHKKSEDAFLTIDDFKVNGETIIKYLGKGGNISIPREINGVTITKIGEHAFSDSKIESVVFPNTIVEIGDYSFANNQIKSLFIPSSVEIIGEGCFIHNDISTIKMNESTIVGNGTFNDNKLDDGDAFFYKVNSDRTIDYSEIVSYGGKNRSSVVIPETMNGKKILTLGNKSFFANNIVAVSIPKTVMKIDMEAFKDNYLVEVYLTSNIKEVGIDAFSNNSYLEEIVIDNYEGQLLNYPWGADKSNLYWLK